MSQIGRKLPVGRPTLLQGPALPVFLFSLMPRPTETMISAAVKSTARSDSRNGASGFCRICPAFSYGRETSTDRRAASKVSARHAPACNDANTGLPATRTSPFSLP